MAGRTFNIRPVQNGFAGYGVDRIGTRKKIQVSFLTAFLFRARGGYPPYGTAAGTAIGASIESTFGGIIVAFIAEREGIAEGIGIAAIEETISGRKGTEFIACGKIVKMSEPVEGGDRTEGSIRRVLVLSAAGVLNANRVVVFQVVADKNLDIANIQAKARCIDYDIWSLSAVMTGEAGHGNRGRRLLGCTAE